jgi:hypothetical protein
LGSLDHALVGRSHRRVLFVHGPGGIGKTTLLLEFRIRARAAGRTVVLLDGREIDPSPEGFEHAVLVALGETGDSGLLAELLAGAVLLDDGYEQLGPIDRWLRQAFLPALPADAVVVLAGRDAPTAPRRTDPGWRSVVAIHAVNALLLDFLGHHRHRPSSTSASPNRPPNQVVADSTAATSAVTA